MAPTARSLLLFVLSSLAVADDFLNSCDAKTVAIENGILTAKCKPVRGDALCTKLDLGKCLKNRYGSIQDDPDGDGPSITKECIDCSNSKTGGGILSNIPTLLHCRCDSHIGLPSSRWPTAQMDIITVVDNANGYLACHGHKGVLCSDNGSDGQETSQDPQEGSGEGTQQQQGAGASSAFRPRGRGNWGT